MCCQKLSDFLTLHKCCCGIPLKIGTYIAGSLMLVYCTFLEIKVIQYIYIRTSVLMEDDDDTGDYEHSEPQIITGAGVGMIDHIMRSQNGFNISQDYLRNFMHGLLIAWSVINGCLITSTCLMLYGNAKDKSILLLQWLVVIATIGIGDLIDVVFEGIYMQRMASQGYRHANRLGSLLICLSFTQIAGIVFAFVVVRSHYYRLTLPSIPVSFKNLESQDIQDNEEEEEYTANEPSSIDV